MDNRKPETGNRKTDTFHGGRREEAARLYGLPREEFLDFSASINPLGPPPGVARALRKAVTEVAHYPESGAASLAAAIADYLGVFPDEVLPGNGSIEIIYWLAAHLQPRRALVVDPTFTEYRRACEAAGATCDSLMLSADEDFALDVSRIEPEGYDLVFICNPNNPSGYLAPLEDVAALWRRCRAAGVSLVLDEAFIDFTGPEQSVLSYGVSEGLYVIRSFTKSHAIPGLRLGCLVAADGFVASLKRRMPPWNINAFAIEAGRAAIGDRRYMEKTRRVTAVARERLFADIDAIEGIEPLPSEANFLLCRLSGIGSGDLAGLMGRQGILVRDCASFPGLGEDHIRVAVRSERENFHLVSALKKAFSGLRGHGVLEEVRSDGSER